MHFRQDRDMKDYDPEGFQGEPLRGVRRRIRTAYDGDPGRKMTMTDGKGAESPLP